LGRWGRYGEVTFGNIPRSGSVLLVVFTFLGGYQGESLNARTLHLRVLPDTKEILTIWFLFLKDQNRRFSGNPESRSFLDTSHFL